MPTHKRTCSSQFHQRILMTMEEEQLTIKSTLEHEKTVSESSVCPTTSSSSNTQITQSSPSQVHIPLCDMIIKNPLTVSPLPKVKQQINDSTHLDHLGNHQREQSFVISNFQLHFKECNYQKTTYINNNNTTTKCFTTSSPHHRLPQSSKVHTRNHITLMSRKSLILCMALISVVVQLLFGHPPYFAYQYFIYYVAYPLFSITCPFTCVLTYLF